MEISTTMAPKLKKMIHSALHQPYLEALETILPANREKAATLIRIVAFANRELTIGELQHALAMSMASEPHKIFLNFIDEKLESFINDNCSIYLTVDEKTKTVKFAHPAVLEFFKDLPESGDKWSSFSCNNEAQGHLKLAVICIHYSLSWIRQPVTQDEIEDQGDQTILARVEKCALLYYAASKWMRHARKAGELIQPFIPLLFKLLRPETEHYKIMMMLQDPELSGNSITHLDGYDYPHPPNFLASHNLIHVLKAFKLRRSGMLFRAAKPIGASSDILEFGVNDQDHMGSSPLFNAAKAGATESLKFLLANGANINLLDETKKDAFHYAVNGNHAEITQILLKRKPKYSEKSTSNTLHLACRHGMEDVVKYLLSKKVNPNGVDDDGWTPVAEAASAGQSRILRRLLKAGGYTNSVGPSKRTPLHLASKKGDFDSVTVLLEFNPELDLLQTDEFGYTPLHLAAMSGDTKTFDFFRGKTPKVKPGQSNYLPIHLAASKGHLAIVESLLDRENVTAIVENEYYALHLAADGGHLAVVKKLVEAGRQYGVDIDSGARDLMIRREKPPVHCITPLMLAVIRGYTEICQYLLENGANKDIISADRRTLLHFASHSSHTAVFDMLIEKGVDPFGKDISGRTPFHSAARNGAAEIVDRYIDFVVAKRVDIDIEDNFQSTPLLEAICDLKSDRSYVVEKLLKHGADPNRVDAGGWSTVMAATRHKDATIVKMLIAAGAKTDIISKHGVSALHTAADWGNVEVAKILLDANADVNLQDCVGQTPLVGAVLQSFWKVARMLLKAKADPCLQDLVGYTAIDFAKNNSILDRHLLRIGASKPKTATSTERLELAKKLVATHIAKLPDHIDLDDDPCHVNLWTNFVVLSKAFSRLGKEVDTQVCLEYYGHRNSSKKYVSDLVCDECRSRKDAEAGEYYLSTEDVDVLLCTECYNKLKTWHLRVSCRNGDGFITIGGKSFTDYAPGTVNAAGQTYDEWVAAKKKEYGVASVPKEESEPTTDKVASA